MRVFCFSLLFDVRSSNSMTDMDTIGKVLSRAFIWAQLRLFSSNILEVIRVQSWGLLREHNIFFHYLIFNQSPKGIMRSAVPLPCFFDIVVTESGKAAATIGDEVMSNREKFYPSIHLSIHLPSKGSEC